MSESDKIRKSHFKYFMSLPADKQLGWAISHGYEIFSLLPKNIQLIVKQMRNGAKRARLSTHKNLKRRIKGVSSKWRRL